MKEVRILKIYFRRDSSGFTADSGYSGPHRNEGFSDFCFSLVEGIDGMRMDLEIATTNEKKMDENDPLVALSGKRLHEP
jgi:hypothetical protein